jgi:hypothetical protein
LDLINPENRYLDKKPFRYEKGIDPEKFIDREPFRPGDLGDIDPEDFIQPLRHTEGIKGKHNYYIGFPRRQVTKEEYDAQTEASKKQTEQLEKESREQDIILGDINELTFKSQDLYDMKLEQLGLPKGSHLPIDEHIALMDALRRLDEKKGKGTYIYSSEDPSRALESFAGGGIMDIDTMTAPLGYANGGPAGMTRRERENLEEARIMAEFKDSEGPGEPGRIGKWWADKFPVDPRFTAKEKIKDVLRAGRTGIGTLKRIGSGLAGIGQELLGAGPAEASDPHPMEGWYDMYHDMINDGILPIGTSFEDFMEMDFDIDRPGD